MFTGRFREFYYNCLAEDFIGWVWAFCGDNSTWFL